MGAKPRRFGNFIFFFEFDIGLTLLLPFKSDQPNASRGGGGYVIKVMTPLSLTLRCRSDQLNAPLASLGGLRY